MAGLSTIQQNIYDGESCTLLNCMDSTGLRLVTRISTAGAQDKVVANTLFKEDAGSVFNNYCVSCPESKFTTKVIFALSEAEVRGWRLNTSEHKQTATLCYLTWVEAGNGNVRLVGCGREQQRWCLGSRALGWRRGQLNDRTNRRRQGGLV